MEPSDSAVDFISATQPFEQQILRTDSNLAISFDGMQPTTHHSYQDNCFSVASQALKQVHPTQATQHESEFHSESMSKRLLFRNEIRGRQIDRLFHGKREMLRKLLLLELGTDQSQINSSSRLCNATKTQEPNLQQEILALLSGRRHIRSDTIRKIWRIVLDEKEIQCLNEDSMEKLIACAGDDLQSLLDPIEESSKKKHLNQRLGQVLWILLNESYKTANTSLGLTSQIVQLCLKIIKERPADDESSNKNANDGHDEYLLGLCIILLGNLCVSEGSADCILQQVQYKPSELVLIVEKAGMLEGDNCQDFSFFLMNLLFYYPEAKLSQSHQVEDLVKLLECLSRYLETDLLMHIHTLQQNATNEPGNKCTPSKIKQERSKIRSGKKIDAFLALDGQQLQKVTKKLVGAKKGVQGFRISENYTNDLMQCIGKLKELLRSCCMGIGILELKIHSLIESVLKTSIKLLLMMEPPFPASLQIKLYNNLTFLRNQFRLLILDPERDLGALYDSQLLASLQAGLQPHLCERMCRWVRKWVKEKEGRYENGENINLEIQEIIENTIWQIYGKLLNLLSWPGQTSTPSEIEAQQLALNFEIEWLQMQLVSSKQESSSTSLVRQENQSYILSLLSEYYPLATIKYQGTSSHSNLGGGSNRNNGGGNRSRNKGRRDERRSSVRFRVSDFGSEATNMEEDYVEYIDVEMGKIGGLLDIFCLKLQEYHDCPTLLCVCLRCILGLLNRLNAYLQKVCPEQTLELPLVLPLHSQKILREVLYTQMLSGCSNGSLSAEICELVEEILHGKKQELDIDHQPIEEESCEGEVQEEPEDIQIFSQGNKGVQEDPWQ